MPKADKPESKDLPTASPDAAAEAQAQADAYGGFARSATVVAPKTGEKFTIPSLLLLDDDQLTAYEELHFKLNQCDRWPDVNQPQQKFVHKNADGSEVVTEVGEHVQRGEIIQPYQKDGELISPPYSIQLAKIFWGEEGYLRFKNGGGRSAEIPRILRELNTAIQERRASDSKSDGSSVDLAPVPETDSE
jgi:hypothetical protein